MIDPLGNDLVSDAYRINSLRVRLIRLEGSMLSADALLPAMEEHLWFIDALKRRDPQAGGATPHPSHRERAPPRAGPAAAEIAVAAGESEMSSAAPSAALRGIWPALLTPLDRDLGIDHARFAAHSRALLAAGCGGVTPFGTTGEGPSFSARRAPRCGRRAGRRRRAGVADPRVGELRGAARHARADASCTVHRRLGCLMLPPFYLKGVSDAGVVDAYRQVIDATADARLRVSSITSLR